MDGSPDMQDYFQNEFPNVSIYWITISYNYSNARDNSRHIFVIRAKSSY